MRSEIRPLQRRTLTIVTGLSASTRIGVIDTLFSAPLGTLGWPGPRWPGR